MAKVPPPLHIANKKDVWHLIIRGELVRPHFDLETSGLERDFAQITSYGDAVSDLAGNFIGKTKILIKRPDHLLYSPHSYAVTRTTPEEHDDPSRLSHREGMSRIVQRIEHMSRMITQLPLRTKKVSFTTVRKNKGNPNAFSVEKIYEYPLRDNNGKIVVDVRYHPDRDKIAYRYSDDPTSPYHDKVDNDYYIDKKTGDKWKFVDARATFRGYRNSSADNVWLRPNMIRAGYHSSNIFILQSRATPSNKQRAKNYTLDNYYTTQQRILFGRQDEEGLKIGTRVDVENGTVVPSAKLGSIMEVNTRYENKQRGIRGGLRMISDDSIFDENKAHANPDYDAEASLSLEIDHLRCEPEILKMMEMQADEQELRRILPGQQEVLRQFSTPPIFVMPRNTYPNAPTADPVMSLGFDDREGGMRRVTMINLNGDLESMSHNGKKLTEMSAQDFVLMIKEQRSRPDPLIRVEPMRRWKGAIRLQDAQNAPIAQSWDFEGIIRNSLFLAKNEDMCAVIRKAIEIINWEYDQKVEPANPMMEEEAVRNGFGTLDLLEAGAKEQERKRKQKVQILSTKGSPLSVEEIVHNIAQDIYDNLKSTDASLHQLALQPHPVDYSDDPADLENFVDLLKRVKAKFKDKGKPYLAIFDKLSSLNLITLEEARDFRWDLMKRTLLDDQKERANLNSEYGIGLFDFKYTKRGRVLYANPSRNLRIVTNAGQELTMEYLAEQHAQNPHIVQSKFRKREGREAEWRIQFERLSSDPSITATLLQFKDMGRMHELDPVSWFKLQAIKDEYLRGQAHEEPSKTRWETIGRMRWELNRLEVNAQLRSKEGVSRNFSDIARGEAEIFLRTDEGQRLLGVVRKHTEDIALERETHPLREAFDLARQADPRTGIPYDRIAHEIPAENIMIIDVPETHLRDPLNDIRHSPYSLIVPAFDDLQKAKITKGTKLLLRGEETGRLYYPGRVSVRDTPLEGGAYSDFYGQAMRAYEDAGKPFPEDGQRSLLIIQKLQPVADTRPDIDPSLQTVKVPSYYFDGLVSPRLAHFSQPFTGLILPAVYCPQKITEGEGIRFREMEGSMPDKLAGQDDYETGHIYESTLQSAQRMTMQELLDRISAGEINDEKAQRFGFASGFDMWEKVNQTFIDHESPDPNREVVLLLEFDPVDKASWAYFNPQEAPKAALTYGGKPVPPSAYRPTPGANDNRSGKNGPVDPLTALLG